MLVFQDSSRADYSLNQAILVVLEKISLNKLRTWKKKKSNRVFALS